MSLSSTWIASEGSRERAAFEGREAAAIDMLVVAVTAEPMPP
jgi:hypothetical protein